MHVRSFAKHFCVLGLLVATACGSSSNSVETPTTAKTSKPANTEAPTAKPKGPRGLDASDNDPALVALAREALECYHEGDCKAKSKWYEPFQSGQQVDFKTLVNLFEDGHPEIRSLAAGVLRGKKGQPGFHRDAAYATRVLDALEHEEDEYVAQAMALAAGHIEVKATGLEERMLKILRFDMRERVRVALTESILTNNWDIPSVMAAVKGMTSDASSDVRAAAVRAFDVPEVHGEACAFWAFTLIDRDNFLVDKCFFYMVKNSCKGQYEEMLRVAEKRPPASPEVFESLCQQADAQDPLTKRFIDDVEKWATSTTLTGTQRGQSLRILAKCDPVRAKKTAGSLTKDPDEQVRQVATELDKSLGKSPGKPSGKP